MMTRLIDALRAEGLDASISLEGRWAELRGERGTVYVVETMSGAVYLTWCDIPGERAVESYPDPHEAIAAGLRRAGGAAPGGRHDNREGAGGPAPGPPGEAPPAATTAAPRVSAGDAPPSPAGRALPVARIAALVTLALVILIASPFLDRGDARDDPVPARVADIADNGDFFDRSVIVTGGVAVTLDRRAFTLREGPGGADRGDREVLVVAGGEPDGTGRPGAPAPVVADVVQVVGRVRRFTLLGIEREIGGDLDDALFANWVGRPAIVATSVALIGRAGVVVQSSTPSSRVRTPAGRGRPDRAPPPRSPGHGRPTGTAGATAGGRAWRAAGRSPGDSHRTNPPARWPRQPRAVSSRGRPRRGTLY